MVKCPTKYRGEKCLLSSGYPVTKNGKISIKRVRNALARGSQQGVIKSLKRAGICKLVKRLNIKSKMCKHG